MRARFGENGSSPLRRPLLCAESVWRAHEGRAMTQASPKQKALFFALAHELGYEGEVVKERAKQHFDLASFNDITTQQLSELIDRLQTVQSQRGQEATTDHTNQF